MEGHEEVRRWLWGPSLTSTKVGLAAKCNCNDRPVLWITAVEDLGDSYPFVRVNLLAWVFPPALSVVASDKGKMSFSNDPFGHCLSLWANPLDVWQKYVYESSVINCKFLIILSFRILFQYFEICISSVLRVYAPHDYRGFLPSPFQILPERWPPCCCNVVDSWVWPKPWRCRTN